MKNTKKTILLVLLGMLLCTCLNAEEAEPAAVQPVERISVAIMNFESQAPGNPEFGSQISDIITARLSMYDQFQFVERKKLNDILNEYKLNLTGAVDSEQAVRIGKLVGAKIMIFGKAFPVDKDLYIVAKIIGTETGIVKGVMAKGKLESELSDILDQLVEKLSETMEQKASELLPKNEQYENKIERLKKQFAGKALPKIAVVIPEVHVNRDIIDPAAQTEIRKVFRTAGFEIIEVEGKALSGWARAFMDDEHQAVPALLNDADIIIAGEAFSEFASRMNDLYCCTARLEINVIRQEDSRIIFSDSSTQRGIDLSEFIAGKNALQAAGHDLGIKVLEVMAENIGTQPEDETSENG